MWNLEAKVVDFSDSDRKGLETEIPVAWLISGPSSLLPPELLQWGPHDPTALRHSFFIVILWVTSEASLKRHCETSKGDGEEK